MQCGSLMDILHRGAEHCYRVRVGEYRIVYQVLVEEKVVTIFYIRHSSVAYRTF